LGEKCSCLVFFGSEKLNVTRRDRKEIYEWIIEQKLEIKEKLGDGIKDEEILRKTEDFHAGGKSWRC
jgi:hypothetical protein